MRNLEVQNFEMDERNKALMKDLNPVLTCRLCEGYLVDATTLVECLHTFCRGCILRYFETTKSQCPVCPTIYKKKSCLRPDPQIQAMVYKLVPTLYVKEMQRREDFYRSAGVRAGSSCSDDSVIDKERDMMQETEELISQCVGDKTQYFSPEDSISLSLEYYQPHLDTTTDTNSDTKCQKIDAPPSDSTVSDNKIINGQTTSISTTDKSCDNKVHRVCDKRYLQCPAGVNMKHLMKFVRMKYGLSNDHRVDIIYKGEVLPNDFSLMDVAYTFKWERKKPMRFFYRIFTPLKIRPIKIVNTTLSTGGKQLQIVPVSATTHPTITTTTTTTTSYTPSTEEPSSVQPLPLELPPKSKPSPTTQYQETESEQQDKERLLANLQLQSKSKAMKSMDAKKVIDKLIKECVYEYEEPDQEEIKRFAEKRDREWALQKKLEEETRPDREDYYPKDHYSKKRKKSKHSKNESNGHKEKKRKLHAEITNNDKTDLKLKVKITTNGHKHKHHKIEACSDKTEISHKDKLLQMRQVRHKHLPSEKSQPAIPTIKLPKVFMSEPSTYGEPEAKKKRDSPKPTAEYSIVSENNNKVMVEPKVEPMIIKPLPPPPPQPQPNNNNSSSVNSKATSRPEVPAAKQLVKKEFPSKIPTAQLERSDQKTFLKSPAPNSDKYPKNANVVANKVENSNSKACLSKVLPIGSITTNNKSLDRKIASLQQRCTIETKNPAKNDKKTGYSNDKGKVINPQYPPGFTLSKIENGTNTRKAPEADTVQDNRPSLEITLIPPSGGVTPKPAEANKPVAKRPPPGTIPLERIKSASVSLKSGISIIPKIPERTDTIGVLDLSKPNKSPESSPRSSPKIEPINGLSSMVNRQLNNTVVARPTASPGRDSKNVQLSNLQMLSKVASEHSTLNKPAPSQAAKPRAQMPNLQTINKLSPNAARPPGLQRMPPKLNEIQKFRPSNPHIRSVRPNQNQNIRNIPNPSLLINRQQQNQNRLVPNSTVVANSSAPVEKKDTSPKPATPVSSAAAAVPNKEVPAIKAAQEPKVAEKKEISV